MNSLTGSVVPRGSVGGNIRAAQKVYVRELVFDHRFEFPSVGEADKLYIAKDENAIYRFDEDEMGYVALSIQDYNNLFNKPQIEGNTLEGDKTFDDLGMTPLSAQELADMWNN